ncbi:MAG: hypothetical protein M3R27_04355 [Bacteroidota bacterium]|nr:hypothetical protein [Bacteroidota bacterium]
MKSLLLNSFIVLLLAGCSFGHYGKLIKRSHPHFPSDLTDSSLAPTPIFGDNFNSFLFKTNIRAYGRDFSGLLVTKQLHPQDYRVIFTTELGMKLFDFGFKDTAFTLHYCVPQFNRPALLKTIQKDIEVLLMNNLKGKKVEHYTDKAEKYDIRKMDAGQRQNYYFIETSSQHLVRIEQAKKRIKKVTFTLSDHKDGFPNKILIQHSDIKLKIELNLLKR